MIRELDVRRQGNAILVGIAIESAVLDIKTNETLLLKCLSVLDDPPTGAIDITIGEFASLSVRLNLIDDASVSIFVDGPDFEVGRNQSAAIWLTRDEMRSIINSVLSDTSANKK